MQGANKLTFVEESPHKSTHMVLVTNVKLNHKLVVDRQTDAYRRNLRLRPHSNHHAPTIICLTLKRLAIMTIPRIIIILHVVICVFICAISVYPSPVMLEQTRRQHKEGQVCHLQSEAQVEGASAYQESSRLDMPLRWEQWYVCTCTCKVLQFVRYRAIERHTLCIILSIRA